jgi:rhamnulokinase
MADEHRFLALDLGAESGRGELVTLRDGKVEMKEVHRFLNQPVRLAGTLHWDVPSLFREILQAIRLAGEQVDRLDGISVDTWGVDFGLLGRDGKLLGNAVAYRDGRTEGITAKAEKVMPLKDIYKATALHTMPINTLFQLHAMQLADSPLLDSAETMLMMADLLGYFLTGVKASEVCAAQTSQLVDKDCNWCDEIIDAFGLPRKMFPKLIGPAETIGPMTADVLDQVGEMGDVPVIATSGHDTGAAVAAVPGEGDNWAFISCGTWSIMGKVIPEPLASEAAFQSGFTSEVTYGAWYFARNILGLWLVQELKRKWDSPADPWDYDRMTAEASRAPSGPLVDADSGKLLAPADMEQALLELLSETGQSAPEDRGQLVRCVLESLALQYAWCLEVIGEVTGRKPDAVYMVGGGIKNRLLCQFTANACGVPVHAGADQCTAMGNALGQALALKVIATPDDIRQIMRSSFEVTTYTPEDQGQWDDKRARYAKLQGTHGWG